MGLRRSWEPSLIYCIAIMQTWRHDPSLQQIQIFISLRSLFFMVGKVVAIHLNMHMKLKRKNICLLLWATISYLETDGHSIQLITNKINTIRIQLIFCSVVRISGLLAPVITTKTKRWSKERFIVLFTLSSYFCQSFFFLLNGIIFAIVPSDFILAWS